MSNGGRRPGGLTALAVINFVLFAWGLLEVSSVAMAGYAKHKFPDGPTEDMAIDSMEFRLASIAQEPGIRELSTDHLIVLASLATIVSIMLLISGIGYLMQHRIVGYVIGCVYAVGSIGSKMFSFLVISPEFHIGGVLVLVYPVLTLYMLNVTFREDFIRGLPRAPQAPSGPSPLQQAFASDNSALDRTDAPLPQTHDDAKTTTGNTNTAR